MTNFNKALSLLIIGVITSCNSTKQVVKSPSFQPIQSENYAFKTENLSQENLKDWWQKDIIEDSIPGISLNKAYQTILKHKKGKEVIVAVLDTKIEINHEDIKTQIWINKDEIPNNGIDDDKNGYVDDINGWNFLGNLKGEDILHQSFDCTRIIREYENNGEIDDEKSKEYHIYLKAKKEQKRRKEQYQQLLKNIDSNLKRLRVAKKELSKYIDFKNVTTEDLNKIDTTNQELKKHIKLVRNYLKYGDSFEEDQFHDYTSQFNKVLEYSLNPNFDSRHILNDDPKNITNLDYGNNIVFGDVDFKHSLPVSGIISSIRNNNIGTNGFSNNIKIMPVVVVASGDEYDKDVAAGIYYAVNNGAQIINMSFGKYFSTNQEWVNEAMKYAEKHNVLIVTGSGNDDKNIDKEINYPTDYFNNTEVLNNFISAGASGYYSNTLKTSFSNYGKENVDIFAPGEDIYKLKGTKDYELGSGTSYASPIISGIAALILSHFPNLTASEIKTIILKSGVSFNIVLDTKYDATYKPDTPFNSLSKSGKIANVYNALILAEKISKTKD